MTRRILASAIAIGIAGCGAGTTESDPPHEELTATVVSDRAPLAPFTPPSPRGCSGAGAYDFCFAFDTGTPLEVHVALPRIARKGSIAVLRFAPVVTGTPVRNLDRIAFTLPRDGDELVLYFQVDPGAVRISLADDGDDFGWSPVVDVGTEPVTTHFSLNLTHP